MDDFRGMDSAAARDLSRRLRGAAGEFEVLSRSLERAVAAADWQGTDAEALRDRWQSEVGPRLARGGLSLAERAAALAGEAREQDEASRADDAPPPAGVARPGQDASTRRDELLLPAELLVGARAFLPPLLPRGAAVSGMLGLAVDTDGVRRVGGELGHLGGVLGDWIGGERVPTVAELGASVLLTTGAVALAPLETVTDTGLLDPRTTVTVHAVRPVTGSAPPQDLVDLLVDLDESASGTLDPGGAPGDLVASGRIRIQTVRGADGTEAYIVHAPPTGGGNIVDPRSWGAQGNSAGWDSNLRAMAGQESAAMADVRAAMVAAGVPDGAEVMIVGHSQGGLTAARLAADPGFNSLGGEPGTYRVTHIFSVGSPVQSVAPATELTQGVNVAHQPVLVPLPGLAGIPVLLPDQVPAHIADPVPRLDLGGLRVDGTRVDSAQVREVLLPAPLQTYGEAGQLRNAHDSVLETAYGPDPTGGYSGSVRAAARTHPVLIDLQDELAGRYLGDDVVLVEDVVVDVGREDLR
ncbi:hypothetical protein [Brachybacterium sp. J153]|uniref:hypothetical protein n=1 Tax=Brachybacterium sp. J153 TaxID=3116488 RepID=UPI002E75FBF1|nr:hypothetical protein [Brachybacterium sp. J153]MEE1618897.1 hypothetical protein [Brachybacterium sp. J153]